MQKFHDFIPIDEFKTIEQMSQKCRESDVPIIVTKNGESDLIMMNMDTFDKMVTEIETATLVNESVNDLKSGAELVDGGEVYSTLMEKYGK